MKSLTIPVGVFLFLILTLNVISQDKSIDPSLIITGEFLGETPPLRDLPTLSDAEWQAMVIKAERKMLNPKLRTRSYPFAETALPKGPDPVWQKEMPAGRENRAPIINFAGQDSPYYPPDANGTAGPNHYMQTINTVYAIYSKTGTLVAGPTAMNLLFNGVIGTEYNDGDPIVLYDEQADRWLAAEFSITGTNDHMLIAVSTTNDPTGTWYAYSFDVADTPDYEKFGIWQDGYYMGTNNSAGNDIYVFERSKMLMGQSAMGIGFNNPWRPTTIDGFMCVPPLDNDGTFAPSGEPGLFITINDDAIGGGSDQLWIYELDVDWTTPANSTFTRTQQLSVASFDSNFGNTWNNISQLGTTQKVDAIPQVIMNPPQYRNFGTYETIVCCHTVDVDNTDHAGIRWYELRRVSSGDWTVRQQGTYAPDAHSRWMGSIMLNGHNEIGLGYSVSSTTIYPALRYCGQSAAAYNAATGVLDVAEEIIQNGVSCQTAANRWGDYSGMQIDPFNDFTFWFTSEYIGTGGARKTKIASFNLSPEPLTALFSGTPRSLCTGGQVSYTSQSMGTPTTWSWTFPGGTPATSNIQNPVVTYNAPGVYDVTLTVGNGSTNNTLTKSGYITVTNIIADFTASNTNINLGDIITFSDNSSCTATSWEWSFPGGTPSTSTSQNPVITYNTEGIYPVTLTATNAYGNDTEIKSDYITVINCGNSVLPFLEDFSDSALPNCWSIIDNLGNGQIWQFNNPGGITFNSTTNANGFAILDSDHYGNGNSQNADLVTPAMNLSDYTTVTLVFQHYFRSYTGSSATLSYSINGGTSWSVIQTWTSSTANAATFNQNVSSLVAGQSNVKFKWNYTGSWGYYWAVDDIVITGLPLRWTGSASSNWNTAANWSSNAVPTSTSVPVISSSPLYWPVLSGDLTIGTTCGDLTLASGAELTVDGNLTINLGNSVTFSTDGELNVSGNWTNNGTFNPGTGTVIFSGPNSSSITKPFMSTDITTYTRATFAKGMTPLAATTLLGPTDDNENAVYPFDFTFNYLGINYNQARISTNGWMSLNETGTTTGVNSSLFSTTAPNTTLGPWFDNLKDDGNSRVSYTTSGSAPSRVFTAEWDSVLTYNSVATERISFQVKLYETTNVIEFHYGDIIPGTNNGSEGASIGIEDATGDSGHFIEATTGSTTTGITTLTTTANWPTVNYRFAPPQSTETFYNVVIGKTSSYADFNVNTTVNGNFTVLNGAAFNVKIGKTLTVQGTVVK